MGEWKGICDRDDYRKLTAAKHTVSLATPVECATAVESQMKKDSCIHANSSRMLCWARALPAEDVPDSLAPLQMAGCRLGLPGNKPREYICINTAQPPPPASAPSLPRHTQHSSSSQNVILRLPFRTCISVEHEVSQMLS